MIRWLKQRLFSPSLPEILTLLIRFPQILYYLPTERQIRDMKSAISRGGFYPKCLKRVHKRAQRSQRERERERFGQRKKEKKEKRN